MVRGLFALLVLSAAGYLALSAYAGYRVARGIDAAEHHSLVVRVGADIVGRTAVERLAIRKGRVPAILTKSPAFWIALRATE